MDRIDMNVREMIKALQAVENKDLKVYAAVGGSCMLVSSVEIYDDAIEIWTEIAIRR
jgi:secreted protein with Ig-like and vWFA domain